MPIRQTPYRLLRLLRSHVRALALFVLPVAAWLACTDLWLPHGASTISLWYAPKTFDQCSRDTPAPGDRFWIPTASQIREAEAALVPMFALRKQQGLPMPNEPQTDYPFYYRHQYIGFTRNGKRLIYLNAYPSGDEDEYLALKYKIVEAPVNACDGGRYFWGALYNPASRTIDAVDFNGRG
jgi:hypothetical protein